MVSASYKCVSLVKPKQNKVVKTGTYTALPGAPASLPRLPECTRCSVHQPHMRQQNRDGHNRRCSGRGGPCSSGSGCGSFEVCFPGHVSYGRMGRSLRPQRKPVLEMMLKSKLLFYRTVSLLCVLLCIITTFILYSKTPGVGNNNNDDDNDGHGNQIKNNDGHDHSPHANCRHNSVIMAVHYKDAAELISHLFRAELH